jgi:hypothetical protein
LIQAAASKGNWSARAEERSITLYLSNSYTTGFSARAPKHLLLKPNGKFPASAAKSIGYQWKP